MKEPKPSMVQNEEFDVDIAALKGLELSRALTKANEMLLTIESQLSLAKGDIEGLLEIESQLHRSLYCLYAQVQAPGKSLMPDIAWLRHLNNEPSLSHIDAYLQLQDTLKPSVEASSQRMPWPAGFAPDDKGVHVVAYNSMRFPHSSPESVLAALREAMVWSEYYLNAAQPDLGGAKQLEDGASFTLRTFGSAFEARVMLKADSAPFSIAWQARNAMNNVCHRWDIYPDGRGGSLVTTEETQKSTGPWLSTLVEGLIPSLCLLRAMQITHFLWLLGLRAKINGWGTLAQAAMGEK